MSLFDPRIFNTRFPNNIQSELCYESKHTAERWDSLVDAGFGPTVEEDGLSKPGHTHHSYFHSLSCDFPPCLCALLAPK